MKTIVDLLTIAQKDLKEFVRDRLRLVTFFIMPIFMMIMTGYIFPSQDSLKDIPIGIANQDTGQYSQQLETTVRNMHATDGGPAVFKVKQYDSADVIVDAIRAGDVSGGLSIPADFSATVLAGEPATVTIVEDQANPQISQMINQALGQVVEGTGKQISTQKITQALSPDASVATKVQALVAPLTAKIQGIVPDNPNYFEFMAPGVVAMIVMTAVLTGLAASISREKEQGTLDGILISPINRLSIILGKALSQAVRGLVQGAIVLLWPICSSE